MTVPSETLLCGCTSGSFFVRPCPEPAVQNCTRCQCPLCRKHGHPDPSGAPAAMLCPACHAEARREAVDDADAEFGDAGGGIVWTAGSGRHSFSYARSGSEGDNGTDDGESPFVDEDYGAFDAVSDYDKNADDGDAYDS